MRMKIGIAIAMLLSSIIQVFAQNVVNPLDYGLMDAKTGIERYEALLKCHKDAVKKSAKVTYAGIGSIDLEIPEKFSSIPLTRETDFAGCTLRVLNNRKTVYLYSLRQTPKPIVIPAENIDNADFRNIGQLKNGFYLVIVSDKNPWVDVRINHDYGHTRKDIMLVKNSRGSSKPVMPYNNSQSLPECNFCEVDLIQKVIKNLNIERDSRSTEKTLVFRIEAQNNVTIENISVVTPDGSNLLDDRMMRIEDCTNIQFENININGTYSSEGHSGYAFFMNNIWNHTAHNVTAIGNWGVYGTNNIHTALIEDCDLNRFDIHCYGRDITSRRTTYRNLFNQFASVYGEIRFENCRFIDCTPFVTAGSYNSYVPVDVTFKSCSFDFSHYASKNACIAKIISIDNAQNIRKELAKKNLPNFKLSGCTIDCGSNIEHLYFLNFGKVGNVSPLGYISNITIKNATINGKTIFDIANTKVETDQPLSINLNKVYKTLNGKKEKLVLNKVTVGLSTTVKCNRKVVEKK